MNHQNTDKQIGALVGLIFLWLLVNAGLIFAQTITIGGGIYEARNNGTGPVFAPAAPAVTGAKVMVQNQHSGGAFITYGTVAGNTWSADVPYPGDYVIMFSATGYDLTSREVTVDAAGNVTHPKQDATGVVTSTDPLAIDAYLPKLYTNPDGSPSTDELPRANLLAYAFYDNMVNGEPDAPYSEDPPLNGVTFIVKDEDGNVLATGVTGSQPSPIVTTDGIVITDVTGLYYFTNLPPGEVIVTSDPSTVTQAANPHLTFADPSDLTRDWYQNYTEEGGPAWDPKLYPGDPGTEAGGFLIWHSYVEKLDDFGAPGNPNPMGTGKISGYLTDADKANLDPDEPFPVPGEDHPGVTLNDPVPDGLVILFTDDETVPTHPVATAEADANGYFEFNNVPAGSYKMMMFDVPLDYVWTQIQLNVAPGQHVHFPPNILLVPRFFARGQGYVYDISTGLPMANQEVHLRYKDGSIQDERITADGTGADPPGWYNFDDMPEIEVMGYVDAALPPGYRGAIITETFYPKGKLISPEDVNENQVLDPGEDTNNNGRLDWVLADDGSGGIDCAALADYWNLPEAEVCKAVTHNSKNRYISWFTANYRADLYLEPIPLGVGQIDGYAFNDHLARGSWTGDGVYDPDEERTLHGVTIELWSDPPGLSPIATTTTGKFDEAATRALGWIGPYKWPPDEAGGVFVGPEIGYYEFRDVAPGNYIVKVIPPTGYSPTTGSPVLGEAKVTVTGVEPTVPTNGDLHTINFGLNTLVPLAGEIEGGVFDDLNIDPRGGSLTPDPTDKQSLLWMEKAGIPDVPVGVYDHLGYVLGVGIMGNPLCYIGSPAIPPGNPDYDPLNPTANQCPAGEDPDQKPEMERRFAPGVHIYLGNDPAFQKGFNPNHPKWGYCPNFLPLLLPYTFGQGKFKFEADWSLVPVAFIDIENQCDPTAPPLPQPNNAPVINNPIAVAAATASITLNPGDVFRITGQYFGDQQGHSTVTLASVPLEVLEWTDTYIDVKIPFVSASGSILVATSTGISNGLPVTINYDPAKAAYIAAHSVYVDASNTGAEDGSAANPYNTINEALDHLPTLKPRYVFVAPGVYKERLHITESNLVLIGAGPQETIINGLTGEARFGTQGFSNGYGPVIFIGDGKDGSVKNVGIHGFTITGGTVNEDDIGAGIFLDYGNKNIDISNCAIIRNGGYYGGGIWGHRSNKNIAIWSNVIAENGSSGGYGGGISFNDEPDEYEEEHGEPEHIWDDHIDDLPAGTYAIFNNVIYHNFAYDYGGGLCLYEVKGELNIFGNVFMENKADDHGGAIFFEDTGPANIFDNVFLRNFCPDDGGAISFEDVGNDNAKIRIYNNLMAENMADDHGENHARGGALAFDDTFHALVYNNTIVGNIVAGSNLPAGGGIDSERNGHEYNGTDGPYIAPGYSDPKIFNNIIWNNWRMTYEQPNEGGEEEDLDYRWGENYQWFVDEMHVDNPHLQPPWESHNNSESFTVVHYNDIRGGYSNGTNNLNVDPSFVDPATFNWRLNAGSPVIDKAIAQFGPKKDLEMFDRTEVGGLIDMGAFEWRPTPDVVVRIPSGILGTITMPIPGSSSLYDTP